MPEIEPPPMPDAPYVIGIHADDGLLHAVDRAYASRVVATRDEIDTRVGSVCGKFVVIARTWGEFRRGASRWVDDLTGHLCPFCAWTVALYHGQTDIDRELKTLTPKGQELAALTRLMPDPMLLVKICQRILDARSGPDAQYDDDSLYWAQHLGDVSKHRPAVLFADEGCLDSHCDHDSDDGCYQDAPAVGCPGCSFRAGAWAGEWEGQYEITVPAPCSVLTAAAKYHGVEG